MLATISDRKIAVPLSGGSLIDYYKADLLSAQDYYAFVMLQPGRTFSAGGYRYGFNGKENDNEVKGEGNQQDYGDRIYDSRLGKFLSVDRLMPDFPYYSPYQFAGNTPIQAIDLDGLEAFLPLLGMQEVMVDVGGAAGRASTIASGGGASSMSVSGSGALITSGSGGAAAAAMTRPWVSWNPGPLSFPFQPQLRMPQPNEAPLQTPQKSPLPQANPERQFDYKQSPTKEDDGEEGYYIYETGSSDKIVSGMVDRSAGSLPYFGITKNAVIASVGTNGRYGASNERAKNLTLYRGILGKTNYYIAGGVEAALIALNTYGKNFEKVVLQNKHSSRDVKKSTRVDNKMFSNKDALRMQAGIKWLRKSYGKNWKDHFLHKENKKGRNNTE